MKRLLLSFSLIVSSLLVMQKANAQNQVYWTEDFVNAATVTSDPGTSSTVYTYNGTAGTWTFFGVYTTTGTGCESPGVSSTANRHIRSTSAALTGGGGAGTPDTPYVISPVVNNGIQEVRFLRSRAQRKFTLWTTADAVPTTTNWVLKAIVPKWNNPTCNDTTIVINDLSAKQLKIVFEKGFNSDIDSIRVTSVTAIPVPITFGAVKAAQRGAGIQVDFEMLTETNVDRYVIERSGDGVRYATLSTLAPVNNNGNRAAYSYNDASPLNGTNYYRVKGIEKDGAVKYSPVVRVALGKAKGDISIAPNPVRGNTMSLQVESLGKGAYTLSLINGVGQQVYNRTLSHEGGSATYQVQLPGAVKAGIYTLQVRNGENVINKKVVVE